MRRPAQTREQKQHAREQRALLRLRRAGVRYSRAGDDDVHDYSDTMALVFAELTAACDAYREAIGERAARKLAR